MMHGQKNIKLEILEYILFTSCSCIFLKEKEWTWTTAQYTRTDRRQLLAISRWNSAVFTHL